jgi:hypothetical protein
MVVAAAVVAATVVAARHAVHAQTTVDAAIAAEPDSAMAVVVDPDTGLLRAPTAEEAAALASEQPLPRSLPVERRRADGTRHVHLGTSMMHYATADVRDGRVHTGCTEDPATDGHRPGRAAALETR